MNPPRLPALARCPRVRLVFLCARQKHLFIKMNPLDFVTVTAAAPLTVWPADPIKHQLSRLYNHTLAPWFARLYLLGPTAIGCWGGLPAHEICSQLTGSPATFWQDHPTECERRISQHFTSYIVLADAILVLLLFMAAARAVMSRLLS